MPQQVGVWKKELNYIYIIDLSIYTYIYIVYQILVMNKLNVKMHTCISIKIK